MSVPPAIELEALLAEDAWIRRLARRLVADPGAAEDLAQETWATALAARREGARAREPRPWMGGILRNLWRDLARSGARRERRERAAARPEATAPADELVLELQLRKQVADCLLELEEPCRRVLFLRFFRDRSLKAIAREEGVSISTVHERIQRGLTRMRERLDRDHGGERDAWAVGLAVLARPPGVASGALLGGLAMGSGIKVAAAVVLLGGVLTWVAIETSSGPPQEPAAMASAPAQRAEGAAAGLPTSIQAPRREALEVARSDPGPRAGTEVEETRSAIRGRVLDPGDQPLAGVPIGLVDGVLERLGGPAQESASDGTFSLQAPADAIDPQPVNLDSARATLARELRGGEWLLVLSRKSPCRGRVVDEAGSPIAAAGVAVEPRRSYFREHGLLRPADLHQERWQAETDADGRFDLSAAPAGEPLELVAWAAGFSHKRIPWPEGRDVLIVLEPLPEGVPLTGLVLDPMGSPVQGARVSTGGETVSTEEDGSFRLLWRPASSYSVVQPDGKSIRRSESHITAVKEGFGPVREELARLDVGHPIELWLRDDLAISGTVVDPAGEELAGIVVWPSDPTPFGLERATGGGRASSPVHVESVLQGGELGCLSSADGRFTLRTLLPREYRLLAYDPRTATCSGPWAVEAGTSAAVLVLDLESGTGRVAGRLVTAEGLPLAGAEVRASRAFDGFYEPPLLGSLDVDARTDEQGRFEFPALAREGTRLAFFHPRIMMLQVPLDGRGDREQLEIVAPLLYELQIDLSSDPGLARSAKVLDGAGQELFAFQSEGNWIGGSPFIAIADGKSEVVRVHESARTVVLYRAGQEVARMPVRLDPDRLTVVQP